MSKASITYTDDEIDEMTEEELRVLFYHHSKDLRTLFKGNEDE